MQSPRKIEKCVVDILWDIRGIASEENPAWRLEDKFGTEFFDEDLTEIEGILRDELAVIPT